jgi:hypothetical protein
MFKLLTYFIFSSLLTSGLLAQGTRFDGDPVQENKYRMSTWQPSLVLPDTLKSGRWYGILQSITLDKDEIDLHLFRNRDQITGSFRVITIGVHFFDTTYGSVTGNIINDSIYLSLLYQHEKAHVKDREIILTGKVYSYHRPYSDQPLNDSIAVLTYKKIFCFMGMFEERQQISFDLGLFWLHTDDELYSWEYKIDKDPNAPILRGVFVR